MKIKANVRALDIFVHLVIWFLLSLITLGIALFFFPYSFAKFIINRSELIDDNGVARQLQCNTDMWGNIGHIVIWILITLVTLGFGYAFYFYKVWGYSLNNTVAA
ncbi:MAG: hypothetical protein Kow0096_22380 [Thiohalomonadaceae bacterium]